MGLGLLAHSRLFSAFSVDTIELLQQGEVVLAISYILVSLIGGLVMVKFGRSFSNKLLRRGAHHVD